MMKGCRVKLGLNLIARCFNKPRTPELSQPRCDKIAESFPTFCRALLFPGAANIPGCSVHVFGAEQRQREPHPALA